MEDIIEFANILENLKKIKRTGWVEREIKNPESVADHSFRVAVLAMVLGDKLDVDKNKLIKMALVHDWAESLVGDIVTEYGNEMKQKLSDLKFQKEKKAFKKMTSSLSNGKEYFNLWIEYEEQKSKEAKILKQLDKLEMALQAAEYEKVNNKNLEIFSVNAEKYIKNKELKKIFDQLKSKRKFSKPL